MNSSAAVRCGLLHQIAEHAERTPEAAAILAPGRAPLSYRLLNATIAETVAALNTLGVGRGDRVAIVMTDGPEMAVACLAVAAGASCAPLNPALLAHEFEAHLVRLRCRALLVPAGSTSPAVVVARTRGIPVLQLVTPADAEAGRFTLCCDPADRPAHGEVAAGLADADEIALVLQTSGTAAQPKVVPLTHRNIAAAAQSIRQALELTPSDRCLSVMPLFHIHGLSAVFASMAAGASVACTGPFAAHPFFEAMEAFQPTWYTAAPSIHRQIFENAAHHPRAVARATLRFIRSASAPMPPQLVAGMERVFGVPLIEAYGMTEAGPQIASNRLSPNDRRPGSVGRAAGPEVAIDNGEVVIRGANVMSAYADDVDATRHALVDGWFRTGDLGHLDADGFLFITGRLKEIVNRGGEKISPREVDEVLLDHRAVAQAVTFPVPHPTLGEDLAAAIVLAPAAVHAPPDEVVRDIRAFASARLAAFKVPQRIAIISRIPTDAGGKVQRLDLARQLDALNPGWNRSTPVAPRTALEERLCRAWASVLGTARLGIHDNFFLSGGDSLKAVQVLARVSGDLQIELPAHTLFQHPTVAELAETIAPALTTAGSEHVPAIPRRDAGAPCPLSFAQQRLWILDQLDPGNPAYNMHVTLRLSGCLSVAALEESLSEMVRRHETLRTTFRRAGGQPVQVVAPAYPLHVPTVDLTRLSHADRDGAARRLAADEAGRPFHLGHGPLLRVTLVKLDADEHLLLLTLHHIVSDGWSTGVLLRELETLYAAFLSDQPSPLPALPVQYGDFAAWQRAGRPSDGRDAGVAYWKQQLAGAPLVLDLPADRPRPEHPTSRGATHAMELPAAVVQGLEALGRGEQATPFMVLLTAFQTLLHRYTGQIDVLVGTPIANRGRVELEGLIGLFANTLVMRGDMSGHPSFREALRRTRTAALGAFAHQDVPFETLVEALQPERDHRINPIFQVMFAYQNLPDAVPDIALPGLTATALPIAKQTAKFDLTVYVSPTDRGLTATWLYNTDLFDDERIARMAGHWRTLLEAALTAPDQQVSELPLLTTAERHELRSAWNAVQKPAGDHRSFHERFEEQTRLNPDAPAVRCGGEQLTYRELNSRANELAWRLQGMGVSLGTRVGIKVTRSTGAVVAVLAVMKAGGAFVPLDPDYPSEHLAFVLDDAKVALVLTDADISDAESVENPASGVTPATLAYVLYTSGSMGRPKGVMITHGNLSHYVEAMRGTLGLGAGDRYLHTASFAFSSSVRQLAVPLSCGASIVLAPSETVRDPEALFAEIARERVTVVDLVPSHWRMCLRHTVPAPHVRLALSASEPLPADLAQQWAAAFGPGVRLLNMFGQTETTGIVTAYRIPPAGNEAAGTVPIGTPIAHTQAYVLDAAGQPVPIGLWGELFIGGAGVGAGYLNDPELTASRFVPDPFSTQPGARLYRTGDVVRRLANGDLEFSGRADHQLKIRGYRVEPVQIETAVRQHPAWRECAVTADTDAAGGRRLIAYVVRHEGAASTTRELRERLKQKLPDYMVPSRLVELPALPRTPSGKVHWAALDAGVESEADTPAPPTGVEETLTAIWLEVLGADRVTLDDNFFDIGGNSILAMEMINRAGQAGLRFTPRQLWQNQTIAELAKVTGGAKAAPAVHTREVDEPGESERIRVTLDSLRAYGCEALERAGLRADGASIVTDVQLEASLRDQPTHNMVSIPRYAQRVIAGTINGQPDIRVEHETGISALIDGDNGPGQWVAVVAMETAMRLARQKGAGIVAVRRSNHLGAAGHYPWLAAREGLIGLCTTNGPVILAPTGGTTPTFGNNPIGVGIPAKNHLPIMLDIAMSVAPRGRIGLALAEGKPLPDGWILDRNGRPSIDPADLVAGLGVPIGGHKGYGLTLVMEVLAGVLSGAGFGFDNRREHNRTMVKPANFGHFFMAIDPELFMPAADFAARVDRLIDMTKSGDKAAGSTEILVPGEAELRARERSLREGVPLRPSTYRALEKYATNAGLGAKLVVVDQ